MKVKRKSAKRNNKASRTLLSTPVHHPKLTNHQVLVRLEKLLDDYFTGEDIVTKGLPTVLYVADTLNLSPSYLSGLLKVLTGKLVEDSVLQKEGKGKGTTYKMDEKYASLRGDVLVKKVLNDLRKKYDADNSPKT